MHLLYLRLLPWPFSFFSPLHMLPLLELQMLQISCSDIFCQKGGKSRHGQRQRRNGFFVHAGQGRSSKKIIARPTTDNDEIVTRCIFLGAPSLTQYLTSSSSSHCKDEGAAQLSIKYERHSCSKGTSWKVLLVASVIWRRRGCLDKKYPKHYLKSRQEVPM